MKLPLPILLLALASMLCDCATAQPNLAAIAKPSDTDYVKPDAIVLYLTNASPEVIRLAKQVSITYGLVGPLPVAGDPGCSVWLEVKPSHSKPGVPYYAVSVMDAGDIHLLASSDDLLEKAVNRLNENAHNESGHLVVPIGKFSYYAK